LLSASWHAHHGVRVVGLNWRTTSLSLETLQEVAECMGAECVAFVCDTMARDYRGWSGGLPDLCLWRPGQRPTQSTPVLATSGGPATTSTITVAADETPKLSQLLPDEETIAMGTLSPPPLLPPPMLQPAAATAAAASAAPVSVAAVPRGLPPIPPLSVATAAAPATTDDDVICLSSGGESDSDANRSRPLMRRNASVPAPRTPVKQPSLHAASPRGRSSPAFANAATPPSRKRAASATATPNLSRSNSSSAGAAKRSKGDSLKSPPSRKNSASSGTQLSLHSFASVLPRFAAPIAARSSSASERASQASIADDEDEDEVMLLDSRPASRGAGSPVARGDGEIAEAAAASGSAAPHWPPFKLVEVKGPGDRCSAQQVAWLAQLARCASCVVEVCYVLMPSQTQPRKGHRQQSREEGEEDEL